MLGSEVARQAITRGIYAADEPTAVVNCAGRIPASNCTVAEMVASNAMLPFGLVKKWKGTPVIHVSTDCVFSGRAKVGPYTVTDVPDPYDIYSVTKRVGEMADVVVVRTSFIGRRHGLMRWAIENRGRLVEGYENVWWSGSTVQEVATRLLDIAENPPPAKTIIHLATERPVTKCDVLVYLNVALELNLAIVPVMLPHINRALHATHTLQPIAQALRAHSYVGAHS